MSATGRRASAIVVTALLLLGARGAAALTPAVGAVAVSPAHGTTVPSNGVIAVVFSPYSSDDHRGVWSTQSTSEAPLVQLQTWADLSTFAVPDLAIGERFTVNFESSSIRPTTFTIGPPMEAQQSSSVPTRTESVCRDDTTIDTWSLPEGALAYIFLTDHVFDFSGVPVNGVAQMRWYELGRRACVTLLPIDGLGQEMTRSKVECTDPPGCACVASRSNPTACMFAAFGLIAIWCRERR